MRFHPHYIAVAIVAAALTFVHPSAPQARVAIRDHSISNAAAASPDAAGVVQNAAPTRSGPDLSDILGPIGAIVDLEHNSDDTWTASRVDNRLVLANPFNDNSLNFYRIPWGNQKSGRSVGVRVQAGGTGALSSAGLLYRYQETNPKWLAWVLAPNDKVKLFEKTDEDLKLLYTADIPGGPHQAGELLQINEVGDTAHLLVNGVELTTLPPREGRVATGVGQVGIIALGKGRFTFRDFALGASLPPEAPRVPGPNGPNQGRDPPIDPLAADVMGATLGILAHEFGHFMIGELDVPATGPEEDVADEFSAMVFIDNMPDGPKLIRPLALGTAKFWWFMAVDNGDAGQPKWYDEHAPDRARFGKFMCMLYGADPPNFQSIMDQTGISKERQQRCINDESKRHAAWVTLLRSHRRRDVAPRLPGDLDPATPGHRVTVEYGEPKTAQDKLFLDYLRQTKLFDGVAESLTKLYVLPRDTKIVLRSCGVVNCFYQPKDGSVTMCYEMLASVLETFQKHQGNGGGGPPPAPSPPPPNNGGGGGGGGGGTQSLEQFISGTWHVVLATPDGQQQFDTRYNIDGSYHSQAMLQAGATRAAVTIDGRWSAQSLGGNMVELSVVPQRWYPQQLCSQFGQCVPLNLGTQAYRIQIVDRNTVQLAEGRGIRIQ